MTDPYRNPPPGYGSGAMWGVYMAMSLAERTAVWAAYEDDNNEDDDMPPMPKEVDDSEQWQWDLLDAMCKADHGWRAFHASLDFDPTAEWGADEGDDRSDREREREAREYPWHACMSMSGYTDTSCHVHAATAKEALHELVGLAMNQGWGPKECTEAAYAECAKCLDDE